MMAMMLATGVFAWLGEKLEQLFDWILGGIKELVLSFFQVVRAFGDTVLETVLSAAGPMMPDVAGQAESQAELLAQINFFFPLSETVAYVTILFGLWVLVFAYRLVKSWIPTVSGS